jgi:hypothetical protein
MGHQRLSDASSRPSPGSSIDAAARDAFIGFGLAAIIVAALTGSIPLGLVVLVVGTALFVGGRRLLGSAGAPYRSESRD